MLLLYLVMPGLFSLIINIDSQLGMSAAKGGWQESRIQGRGRGYSRYGQRFLCCRASIGFRPSIARRPHRDRQATTPSRDPAPDAPGRAGTCRLQSGRSIMQVPWGCISACTHTLWTLRCQHTCPPCLGTRDTTGTSRVLKVLAMRYHRRGS